MALLCCFALTACGMARTAEAAQNSKSNPVEPAKKVTSVLRTDGYYYRFQNLDSHKSFRNDFDDYASADKRVFLPLVLSPEGNAFAQSSLSDAKAQDAKPCFTSDGSQTENSLKNFECLLTSEQTKKQWSLWKTGDFEIVGTSISLRMRYSDDKNPEFEESGFVLNDSSFVLKTSVNLKNGSRQPIDKKFCFRHFDNIPNLEKELLAHKKKIKKKLKSAALASN